MRMETGKKRHFERGRRRGVAFKSIERRSAERRRCVAALERKAHPSSLMLRDGFLVVSARRISWIVSGGIV